jgi:beta-glucoside operon transcriptional antiterminator
MPEKITQILQVVSSATGMRVDSDSMSVSRFVTHLRYLYVRIDSGRQIADSPAPS